MSIAHHKILSLHTNYTNKHTVTILRKLYRIMIYFNIKMTKSLRLTRHVLLVRGYMFRSLVTIIRPFCESIPKMLGYILGSHCESVLKMVGYILWLELIHKRAWWWSPKTETCSLAPTKHDVLDVNCLSF